jgi:septal ring factor EnvC (AmiA/AmiB activator)
MRTSLLASSLIVFATLANPAHALFGDDEARRAIVELRAQMQTQQETQMRLYERIESLTKEVKNLRGQLDDLKNSYGKQQNMVGDLNTKIQEMDPKVQANQAAQDKKIQQRQELDNALKLLNQINRVPVRNNVPWSLMSATALKRRSFMLIPNS